MRLKGKKARPTGLCCRPWSILMTESPGVLKDFPPDQRPIQTWLQSGSEDIFRTLKHFHPARKMMTADQYTELITFLADKFGRVDQRFDTLEGRFDGLEGRVGAVEGRLVKVEVGLEALRHDVQFLAEGLTATNDRLDRYHQDHEVRIRALEVHWFEA
jgi:hypothetical protein